MNKPSAISGTFVALTPVASRKVVRLHIECAIELADDILACLGGYPDPANPRHVAVAQLNIEALEGKPKREFRELPGPQQAGIMANDKRFWAYLFEWHQRKSDSPDKAAEHIRSICGVDSRSEFKPGTPALQRWNMLASAYLAWLEKERVSQ